MKLSLLRSLLAATLVVGAQGNCSSKNKNNDCRNAPGCQWSQGSCVSAPTPAPVNNAPPPPTYTPCSSRNGGSCENGDGMCLKVKGDCQDVNGGSGIEDDSCQAMLTLDSDGDYFYADVPGQGCASGVLCDVAGAFNSDMVDVPIQGTCKSEACMGKKVPGNCNGNNPNDPTCVATTERVTICHRTCSAKNPWVRITIDEDAWDGEGCGHKQHDIRDECSNKAPWTEWGVNRRDYLLKRHGTRDQVAAKLGGKTADIKAYWKQWEHACPYVRNGACCDWDDAENPCCGDAPVESVVPAQAQCPYQTLDFNNLVNPMARWYGQDSVLKAGDFLYDQLWYTHGVKVSARVRWNSHRDDSKPYIPKYERGGSGWTDAKMEQDRNQPSSGGAVMLFDTLRPTYSSDPRYHQPLCPNASGKGDPDLGAPNGQCEGGGPGHGPGGVPFDPDTNMVNPWANCDELGLVGIIQESDDGCPDDTGKGGFITFEFRQPIEFLKLASLLDIDEGNTPNIKVYYNGGSSTKVFDTTATGDNGLFPLEFDTYSIKEVTMIDIEYWGSGSINSLVYPYCPETPTPKIEIKKFAGPPGMCSATGKAGMEDNMYTLPSSSDSWAYCYEVSIPSDSEECLYDIDMRDFAEIGGTSGWQTVKEGAETMCPGDKVYIPGTTKPGDMAPEGMNNAKVRGYGYYSGIKVTDVDPAAVEVYEEVTTPPPTAAPTVCFDHGETADTICPNSASSAISTIGIKSDNDKIVPDGLVPSSIFYNLEFTGTTAAPEVSFKVDNPFDFDVNMMIQYHERPSGSSGFALDPACEGRLGEPGCNPSSASVKAGCIKPSSDGTPFTLVSIFFISDNPLLGAGGSEVQPFECCPIPDADANKPIIEYTFKIMCECPSTARKLRGVAGNESTS